jgi:hypothetical protein
MKQIQIERKQSRFSKGVVIAASRRTLKVHAQNLLSSEETKRSNLQALARWALRNTLSPKVKRITIPLEDNSHLLLVTTEVNADHNRIIEQVLKLV